jgi:acyl-CoA reductase-like NAD-dependent aldehyde dehydrogenase
MQDDAHAVELANNLIGLGSGVFTENTTWRKISFTTGSSFVNKLVVSDPRLPWRN